MKKLTAAILFCLLFGFAHADTFTVTSNADSGPGTLREAITLSNGNGTATADLIVFNIPGTSEDARTIILLSELPALSSNLTIDGSTQPGSALGISQAKVTLYLNRYTISPFVFLFINSASHVKIFGLCFKYFDNPDAGGASHYAIYLRNASNITVGAPGKGNLFSAVLYGVTNSFYNYYTDSVRAVVVQSNVFGLDSQNWPVRRGSIDLIRAADITIGGPTPEEGNVFVAAGVSVSQGVPSETDLFVKVQHNKFNLDWTGSQLFVEAGRISINGASDVESVSPRTFILDNVIASQWSGGISLVSLKQKVLVQGNKLGTDITGTKCEGAENNLAIIECADVTVGGYLPGEENIIAGELFYYQNESRVNIIRNQFRMIRAYGSASATSPFISITEYRNGLISGKANPNAKIQLYTNSCNLCINRKYLTTVYANAAGEWNFPYTASMPNIVATATTADSTTSEFSEPVVDHLKAVVKNTTCGKSNGSVTGIVVTEGTHIRWLDSYTLKVVSTDTNLVNVPAGNYVLTVSNGENGCWWNVNYAIYDASVPSNVTTQITPASCGKSNGRIDTDLSYNIAIDWLNSAKQAVGHDRYVENLLPGTYYLRCWLLDDTACSRLFGPYSIQNQSGPSLNTDNISIQPAVCGGSNGSIRNIVASNTTGAVFLQWSDSAGLPVGSELNLLNVPPGKYRLKFKDAGGCDTIITSFYTVGNAGAITIDTSGKRLSPAKCSGDGGSIQGIKITGGESFVWKNTATGTAVGTNPDAYNLPAATYQLTITNDKGCSLISPPISVPQAAFQKIEVLDSRAASATCDQPNGYVAITRFSRDTNLYTFRWVDSATGRTISRLTSVYNIDNGSYFLFAKDTNGCEQEIMNALLLGAPKPSFDYTRMQITPDQCLAGTGAIQGILAKNVSAGTASFAWINANGDTIGRTLDVRNLPQGSYRLQVNNNGCVVESQPVVVNNITVTLPNPLYDEQTILKNTTATLKPKNSRPGTYQLYADPSASILLQQNSTGDFSTPQLAADAVFYVRFVNGVCQSELVAVPVKVVDKTAVYVPTAFTPNGDGKNDVLKAIAFGKIKLLYFSVYNRWGGLVFSTTEFSKGWNGTVKGQPAEPGVYIWLVKAIDELTGKPIEQKGTVAMIR